MRAGYIQMLDYVANVLLCGRRYWTMLFDTNPSVVREVNERLRSDPRVLRWTTLLKGVTLPEITQPENFMSKTVVYPAPPARQSGREGRLDKSRAGRERHLDSRGR